MTSTIAKFADYRPVNVCRICGSESGGDVYCGYHRRHAQLVKPQVQRVVELARRERVHRMIEAWWEREAR